MYPFNYPTPQNANIDIFDAPAQSSNFPLQSWVKPPNVGMVWITAIGAGGAGGTGSGVNGSFYGYGGGGGSGAIINCLIPAVFVPYGLTIQVGMGGTPSASATLTEIYGQNQPLISASSGSNGADAVATVSANVNGAGGAGGVITVGQSLRDIWAPFALYNLTAGAAGLTGTSTTVSTTTCILGGSSGASATCNGQYGYSVSDSASSTAGLLTFAPLQTFGGNRRYYDTATSANSPQYVAPNGAGGAGGGSRLSSPTCPGHRGGNGLVIIISW